MKRLGPIEKGGACEGFLMIQCEHQANLRKLESVGYHLQPTSKMRKLRLSSTTTFENEKA